MVKVVTLVALVAAGLEVGHQAEAVVARADQQGEVEDTVEEVSPEAVVETLVVA